MAKIELEHWINRKSVENAYREAKRAQEMRRESIATIGMRAAKARDPKLLKALEGGAEIIHQMAVEQWGPAGTMEFAGGVRCAPTEANLWREAYKSVDSGEPNGFFMWIYGSAAILAGLT